MESNMEELEKLIKEKMSLKRWHHSLGVAETAENLASFWSCNREQARLAGLLHDYAREFKVGILINIASQMGHNFLKEERENPVVLHAPVGSFLVQKDLGIQDPDVLSAISKHTVGGCPMSLLDQIIFLADLVEPKREWPGVIQLRKLVYEDINKAMLVALEGTIEYLRKNKRIIHPITLKTLNCVEKRILSQSSE